MKMKKLVKLSALALVLIMLVATFASCAAPAKDPKDAKKALEDAGYTVILIDTQAEAAMNMKGLEAVLMGYKEDDETDGIAIYYFADKEAANEAWEDIDRKSVV